MIKNRNSALQMLSTRVFSNKKWMIPVVIVVLCLVPLFVTSNYRIDLIIWIFIFTMFATCVHQVAEVDRILFGSSAFIGIGAYVSTVLVMHGMSYWLAMPLAGLGAVAVALIVGYPLLKISGIYFAIITWSFVEVLVTLYKVIPGLGGIQGFYNIPGPVIMGVEFKGTVPFFYLALGLMVLTIGFFYRLQRSRFGRDLKVIGNSDVLASALGINVPRYRLICFALASFFLGMGGSFYAHYVSYIEPTRFGIGFSSQIFAFSVIGGLQNLWGALVGSTVMTLVPEALHAFEYVKQVIYGGVIIFIMVVMPGGLVSIPSKIREWRRMRRTKYNLAQ